MELKNTEKQEHSVVALTIEITKAEFEAAKDKAFKKTGKNITVPGFRKGKAPRKMIEKLYGEGVFFEEAFNIIYPDAMEMAVEKSGIKPVGRADVDLGDPAEEGGLTIIAKVPVEPEVELGEYKGIEVEKETVKVLQADVKAELNRMAQRNARTETVERKAKKNDTVDIDFEGFVDGVPFEGGKAEHHELTLGSGAFIPGFEDQLIGCKAGESDADYEAAVKVDIQQSQQAIEPITGEKVNALSYPEGAYGTLTMDALRSQGIELTFTTQPGVNAVVQGMPQTLYSMHRITMTEDTNMDEFLAELAK